MDGAGAGGHSGKGAPLRKVPGGGVVDGFSTSATLGYRPLVVRWADEGLPGGGNPGR